MREPERPSTPVPPPPTPATPRRRRARRVFAVFLALFVIALVLVALEILLRLTWTPPLAFASFSIVPSFIEPEPGAWEPAPGFTGRFQEAPPQDLPPSARFTPRTLEIQVNRSGLRGPELGSKAPGERRILFGGDSLTFGHAVDQTESFPARTAALLGTADRPVRDCNAGVPGYGFAATCRRLRRLRDRVGPDALVAAYFLGNDFTDDIEQLTAKVVAGRMFQGTFGQLVRQSWRGRLCVHSRLSLFLETWLLENHASWSLLTQMVSPPEQAARRAMLPADRLIGGLFLDAAPDHSFAAGQPPVVATWLADLESALRELRTTAGDLPLLVVVLPTQYHVDTALRARVLAETRLDPALLTPGAAQQRLLALCERLGIASLDATTALVSAGQPTALFQPDHTHLSVRGNDVVARAVAGRLRPMLR